MIKTHGTWKRRSDGKPAGRRASPCPRCKAGPGESCFRIMGAGYRKNLKTLHSERGN